MENKQTNEATNAKPLAMAGAMVVYSQIVELLSLLLHRKERCPMPTLLSLLHLPPWHGTPTLIDHWHWPSPSHVGSSAHMMRSYRRCKRRKHELPRVRKPSVRCVLVEPRARTLTFRSHYEVIVHRNHPGAVSERCGGYVASITTRWHRDRCTGENGRFGCVCKQTALHSSHTRRRSTSASAPLSHAASTTLVTEEDGNASTRSEKPHGREQLQERTRRKTKRAHTTHWHGFDHSSRSAPR